MTDSKRRVAVSVGHYATQPGKLAEFSECSVIVGLLMKELAHSESLSPFLIGSGGLTRKIRDINRGNFDLGVEIHLNAGRGTGCETLYCPGSKNGLIMAQRVQESLVASIGYRDRGVKEGWFRMDKPGVVDYVGDVDGDENLDGILKYTKCPFIIPEPYFLDDPKGIDTSLEHYTQIAKAISKGLQKAVAEMSF